MERVELRQDATFKFDAADLDVLKEALGSIIYDHKYLGNHERLDEIRAQIVNTLSEMGLFG